MKSFRPPFPSAQPKAGRFYPPQQVRKYVAAFERSGLSVASFARERGLSPYLLRRWLRESPRFVGTRGGDFQNVPLGSLLGPAWAAEVVSPRGLTVRFSAQVPPCLVLQLVGLL